MHGSDHRPCQLVHIQWQPEMPWLIKGPHAGPTSGAGQTARLDVWLAEKIFDMRSDFDIWLMMKRLQPCLPIVARPSPPPRQALPADVPSAYRFSLAGLMCSMQSAGYAEAKQPAALKIELFAFQRQSLQWMLDQEQSPGGMNAAFWEEHPLPARSGRKSFFYNPTCGELMSNATMQDGRPPLTTGGFLCEEMGLGKTVELLSLVLSNPYDAPTAAYRVHHTAPHLPQSSCTRATLVVVPLSLLSQWSDEVDKP